MDALYLKIELYHSFACGPSFFLLAFNHCCGLCFNYYWNKQREHAGLRIMTLTITTNEKLRPLFFNILAY